MSAQAVASNGDALGGNVCCEAKTDLSSIAEQGGGRFELEGSDPAAGFVDDDVGTSAQIRQINISRHVEARNELACLGQSIGGGFIRQRDQLGGSVCAGGGDALPFVVKINRLIDDDAVSNDVGHVGLDQILEQLHGRFGATDGEDIATACIQAFEQCGGKTAVGIGLVSAAYELPSGEEEVGLLVGKAFGDKRILGFICCKQVKFCIACLC